MTDSIATKREFDCLRIVRTGLSAHVLRNSQYVPRNPRETFSFFENPLNLPAITPPWLDFRIIGEKEHPRVHAGAQFDYRIRWFGIAIGWRSRITEYRPGEAFTDEQLQGPYRRWIHRHLFFRHGEGTMLADEVQYVLPLAAIPLGGVIRRQLRDIFTFRRKGIAAWASASATAGVAFSGECRG